MGVSNNTLIEYYRTMFLLQREHHYSLTELENMYPFERDLFIDLIMDQIDREQDPDYGKGL